MSCESSSRCFWAFGFRVSIYKGPETPSITKNVLLNPMKDSLNKQKLGFLRNPGLPKSALESLSSSKYYRTFQAIYRSKTQKTLLNPHILEPPKALNPRP